MQDKLSNFMDNFNNSYNNQSSFSVENNSSKTPKYVKVIVGVAAVGIFLALLIRLIPWFPFGYLRVKLSGVDFPQGERFECRSDDDCVISCSYGAVNKEWYYARLLQESCVDGCNMPFIDGPDRRAKCLAGKCISFVGNRIDDECTGHGLAP